MDSTSNHPAAREASLLLLRAAQSGSKVIHLAMHPDDVEEMGGMFDPASTPAFRASFRTEVGPTVLEAQVAPHPAMHRGRVHALLVLDGDSTGAANVDATKLIVAAGECGLDTIYVGATNDVVDSHPTVTAEFEYADRSVTVEVPVVYSGTVAPAMASVEVRLIEHAD